jgi:hypothetical protein
MRTVTLSKGQRRWLARYRAGLKGIKAFSVGTWPHDACQACNGTALDLSDALTVGGAASVMAFVLDTDTDTCSDCNGKGTSCECSSCSDFDPETGDEGSFSWSSCDACGSSLGGTRHAAHGLISPKKFHKRTEVIHLDVCTDCLFYTANGDLPEGGEE